MNYIGGYPIDWLHIPSVDILKVAPGYNVFIEILRDQSVSEIISIISDNKTEASRFQNKDLTMWNPQLFRATGSSANFYAISIESISL